MLALSVSSKAPSDLVKKMASPPAHRWGNWGTGRVSVATHFTLFVADTAFKSGLIWLRPLVTFCHWGAAPESAVESGSLGSGLVHSAPHLMCPGHPQSTPYIVLYAVTGNFYIISWSSFAESSGGGSGCYYLQFLEMGLLSLEQTGFGLTPCLWRLRGRRWTKGDAFRVVMFCYGPRRRVRDDSTGLLAYFFFFFWPGRSLKCHRCHGNE